MNDCSLGKGLGSGVLAGGVERSLFKFVSVFVCFLFLFVVGAKAQNTADVFGVVTDPSGAAVPGATVTITNLGTNAKRSMKSSSGGNYAFTLLSAGTYSIDVQAQGFKEFVAPSLTLAAGDHITVNAQLQVGAVSQTVTVSAAAAPVLQTASSTVSTLITPTATQNLPLNGRNFINLAQLAPGASEGSQSSLSNGTRPDDRRLSSAVSANGFSESFDNFLIDGVDDNERSIATIIVKPAIDSIEEMRVETNMYSASISRVGGAVVDITTKSGTNNFHGDAFEFNRNAAFSAKDAFNTGAKPTFTQNDFGGSIGGPIKKNKAFFFADYEGLRITRGVTFNTTVPTPCELGRAACNGLTQLGNFSDMSTPIYNPYTGAQYQSGGVNNVIPIAPAGQSTSSGTYAGDIANGGITTEYASLVPSVTNCSTPPTCSYISNPSQTNNFDNADARVDFHLTPTQTLFGRYTINNGNSSFPGAWPGVTPPGLNYTVYGDGVIPIGGAFPGANVARQQNFTLGWDAVLKSNFLVDFRAAWSRYVSISTANNASHNVQNDFGGPVGVNTPTVDGSGGLALASFANGNYSAIGDQFALPTAYWDDNFQYAVDFSLTKGPQTFKFGVSVLRRNWVLFQQLFKGRFQFESQTTNGTLLSSCSNSLFPTGNGCTGAVPGAGNSFASFLIGLPFSTNQSENLNNPSYRDWEPGLYFEDDWQATHSLTLNLGVRYDVFTPFTEKHNTISNFDPTNLAVLESGHLSEAGQFGVPANLGIYSQRNMVQPRLGFAASITPTLVLRGGFGTSYFVSNSASPATLRNQPWGYAYSAFTQPISTPLPIPTINFALECLSPACGYNGPATNSVPRAMATNFQNALVYMGNLTLQKAFGPNSVTAQWVGEYGRHLNLLIPNIDQPLPPGSSGCTNVREPGPCQPYDNYLPYTTSIGFLTSNGASSYNAGNLIFTRRAAAGLTVQANYTYSQGLADTGGPGGACTACGIFYNNPRSDWGFSDYDVRHRIAIEADYLLPFGKSMTGLEGGVIKGWEVNGIYSFESGLPFTVTDGTHLIGIPGVTARPNMVGTAYSSHALTTLNGAPAIQWFAPTDFSAPAAGFEGNEERNQLFAPAEKTLSFSLFKDFPIRETKTIQFRAEVFNLTNTPSYSTPNTGISGYSGGVATTAGGLGYVQATNAFYTPREFQFAVKFLF